MSEINRKNISAIIVRPRITEKASVLAEKNFYTFEVEEDATKPQIKRAIREIYKVTPLSVNIVPIPRKQIWNRGKWGMKKGGKKAYVELKKGDKIEFV